MPEYRYDPGEAFARRSGPGRGAPEMAQRQLEEADKFAGGLVDEYPNVPLYQTSQALSHDRLGGVPEQLGQPDGQHAQLEGNGLRMP